MKKEEINYYFNQYWAFNNPQMLREGKLTNLLFKIYEQEYRKVPKGIETRLFIINNNYKEKILNKKLIN
jgi:hypothetical protein